MIWVAFLSLINLTIPSKSTEDNICFGGSFVSRYFIKSTKPISPDKHYSIVNISQKIKLHSTVDSHFYMKVLNYTILPFCIKFIEFLMIIHIECTLKKWDVIRIHKGNFLIFYVLDNCILSLIRNLQYDTWFTLHMWNGSL